MIEIESEEEENHANMQTTQDFFQKKNVGPQLREFEAIDLIHERLRGKLDEGLVRLEPLIKKQLHSLYYDRKVNVYQLMQEKRKQDDLNIEKLFKKTQVPINLMTYEEENLKKVIKDYGIDTRGLKLPFNLKIRQIGTSVKVFYRYKKD